MPEGWVWDETLYRGSAPYYARGRPPYAPGLADRLAALIPFADGSRLLDVGCGPGILTLPLAPHVAEAVGVDPDPGMLAEAARRATVAGVANARWVQARAEVLPAGLGRFRAATFGQSFHWMDRERVAAAVRRLLEPGGAFVLVADAKEPRADPGDPDLPHPEPPYEAIRGLIREWLGPVPRAGQGLLRHGTPDGEAAVLAVAGFAAPERLRLPAGGVWVRTEDEVVAWVWSLAGSAPHLFGERLGAFEVELRGLLRDVSPAGRFADRPPDTEVRMWRSPG
jgi:SAM-dependent methyltransferase